MDARDAKRQRLSNFENCCTDTAEHHDARLATELAAAEDVHGLLLLESGLHTVLAQPDAECAKVVGFLSRPSTCERLVHELLLSDVNASNSDPEAADVVLGEGEGILASLVASDAGRAAFAASCVLGGGVPEIAATLATSSCSLIASSFSFFDSFLSPGRCSVCEHSGGAIFRKLSSHLVASFSSWTTMFSQGAKSYAAIDLNGDKMRNGLPQPSS